MAAERDRYWAALEAVANRQEPCLDCGRGHEYRVKHGQEDLAPGQHPMMTWADPEDGHAYRRMPTHVYARAVLDEVVTP